MTRRYGPTPVLSFSSCGGLYSLANLLCVLEEKKQPFFKVFVLLALLVFKSNLGTLSVMDVEEKQEPDYSSCF